VWRKNRQLDGRGQTCFDDADHGLGVLEGFAEIAARGGGEKLKILNVKRPVQTPAFLRARHFGSVGLLAQQHQCRIAGGCVNQQKDEQADEQQNRHGSRKPTDEIAGHLRFFVSALRGKSLSLSLSGATQ